MKESEYIEIAQCLRDADNVSPLSSRSVALPDGGSEDPLFRVARQFSDVHLDTIVNIAWQLHARACKRAAAAQVPFNNQQFCFFTYDTERIS
jgi:hypothetical protein